MARKMKLEKYSELAQFPNVIQVNETCVSPLELSEKWDPSRNGADRPVVLEVGCGTAEHTLHMAAADAGKFFIGLDIKGSRIWHGASRALERRMENVLFIRMRAEYLAEYFPAASISEIWITFPDPHLKRSLKSMGKRLTSPGFIEIYRKIMAPDGVVHVKTDNGFLYDYSKKSIFHSGGILLNAIEDLHEEGAGRPPVSFVTAYERRYIRENRKIRYIKFGF